MLEKQSVTRLLTHHFFRRFFDSDTVQIEGETLTTVMRAIAMVAAPGLICAFFLQNQYPGTIAWGAIEDQYFFVLLSFVVMGAVAIFEWEMLFPDRSDFLILTPIAAETARDAGREGGSADRISHAFPGELQCVRNTGPAGGEQGSILSTAISRMGVQCCWQDCLPHSSSSRSAGCCFVCWAPHGFAWFRRLCRCSSIAAIVLLMLQYLRYGDSLQTWLAEPLGIDPLDAAAVVPRRV